MNVATGTYTGNGTSLAINGIGFAPKGVITKRSTAVAGVLCIPLMITTGFMGMALDSAGTQDGNSFVSLDADGFTVGSSTRTNANGGTYYWVAFDESAGECKILTWAGDDSDDRSIAGAGLQPDFVMAGEASAGNFPIKMRFLGQAGDATFNSPVTSAIGDLVQAFQADGIQVGTGLNNSAGSSYFAICLKAVAGNIAVETYTGNGLDDRSITGFDMTPDFAMVKENGLGDLCLKYQDHPAGESCFCVAANAINLIQALEADGIQVGSDADINADTITYYALGLSPVSSPPAGQPGRFFLGL